MKRIINYYLIFIALSFSVINAGEKVGTTSFQFLKLALDARSAAMGNAFVSVANTSEAIYWNPAALRKVNGFDISLSYIDYFLDVNLFSGAVSFPMGDHSLGLFTIIVDYGNFEVTDVAHQGWNENYTRFNPGLTGEIIKPNATVFGISYAYSATDKFNFGVTVKYIYENLVRAKTSAFAFDGGLTYETGWKSIKMGMSVRNFGYEIKFINEPYPIPETFTFGISAYVFSPYNSLFMQTSDHSLLISYDLMHPRDYDQQHNIGFEYSFKDFLFLRAGYKINYDEEGLTLGFGIKTNKLRFDYAYDPFGSILPTVHRFSIGFELN